ncbi:MAG: TIGR04283 family arsenosugar biosynthesis glycosyltransferase [Pseudomonadota bacterium]
MIEECTISSDPKGRCVSVVIPTLNSADRLPATLSSLASARASGLVGQVIVSDGGSSDETCAVAHKGGAQVVQVPQGRGQQLAAGANHTAHSWLLFLHDDSRLEDGWQEEVGFFIGETHGYDGKNQAAVFSFALDDPDPRARRVERLARWRGERLALPYGDQGLLIERCFYDQIGGFRPITLMEDVDIVRRIGRHRITQLRSKVFTSSVRYRKDGWWARPVRNLTVLALYFLGMPQRVLTRLYG